MKMNLLALGLGGALLALTGCVGTLDGKHAGAIPFLNDKHESRYERTPEQVLTAARDTLAFNGVLKIDNLTGNTLEAKVDRRRVWILAEPVASTMTRVVIQVRTKMGGTDKRLAADLDKQIAVRLATGNLSPATAPLRIPAAPRR
jgi:hypothetical protein